MRRSIPVLWLVVGLLAASGLFYLVDFVAYPGLRGSMGFYTLLDIAFIPLNVLIVGLFINRLIAARERDELLHKMNMVIGAFFSQMGSDLIARLSVYDVDVEEDRPHMLFASDWTPEDFEHHRRAVCGDHHRMRLEAGDLFELRDALAAQRPFVLGLLQNGNLLEHASFTDMLWAVSHLSEELSARPDLGACSLADRAHLELDLARAYGRLLGEWLLYVRHLKARYPYLYAFAVRTNPFDANATVGVEG
jgi:hypothetical protein